MFETGKNLIAALFMRKRVPIKKFALCWDDRSCTYYVFMQILHLLNKQLWPITVGENKYLTLC